MARFLKTGEFRKKKKKGGRGRSSFFPEIDVLVTNTILSLMKEKRIPSMKEDSFTVRTLWKKKKERLVICKVLRELYWKIVREKKVKIDLDETAKLIIDEAKDAFSKCKLIDSVSTSDGDIFFKISESWSESHQPTSVPKMKENKTIEKSIIVEWKPAIFKDEFFRMAVKGQETIHNITNFTKRKYIDFACDSCLVNETGSSHPFGRLGTYHLTFRLKTSQRLLGFIVVDILPSGVSNVLYWYDLSFRIWEVGKWMQLKLIDMIRKESERLDGNSFRYYYLGYYVHDCGKMQYKSTFRPSELLCNYSWQWAFFEDAVKVLETRAYGSFCEKEKEEKEEKEKDGNVVFWYEGKVWSGKKRMGEKTMKRVKQFRKVLEGKNFAFVLKDSDFVK